MRILKISFLDDSEAVARFDKIKSYYAFFLYLEKAIADYPDELDHDPSAEERAKELGEYINMLKDSKL